MRTKILWLLILSLFVASNFALAAPAQKPGDETGFKLLEKLVLLLDKAGQGSGDVDAWNASILGLAKELKSARDAEQVDALFTVRYSRLLSAVRQALLSDPDLLYWPMYRFSMIDFIEERTGRMPDWNKLLFTVNDHGGSSVGLATIVEAVMSEVVSLHIYLETVEKREGIFQTYLQKIQKAREAGK